MIKKNLRDRDRCSQLLRGRGGDNGLMRSNTFSITCRNLQRFSTLKTCSYCSNATLHRAPPTIYNMKNVNHASEVLPAFTERVHISRKLIKFLTYGTPKMVMSRKDVNAFKLEITRCRRRRCTAPRSTSCTWGSANYLHKFADKKINNECKNANNCYAYRRRFI